MHTISPVFSLHTFVFSLNSVSSIDSSPIVPLPSSSHPHPGVGRKDSLRLDWVDTRVCVTWVIFCLTGGCCIDMNCDHGMCLRVLWSHVLIYENISLLIVWWIDEWFVRSIIFVNTWLMSYKIDIIDVMIMYFVDVTCNFLIVMLMTWVFHVWWFWVFSGVYE